MDVQIKLFLQLFIKSELRDGIKAFYSQSLSLIFS